MRQRSIFMPEDQKQKVADHNTFSNDVVGVFAFSMGISSLASSNPTTLASISFLFCCVWMAYKGLLIFTILRRAYDGVPWWKQTIDGFLENFIYIIGLIFVGLIAFEVITVSTFESWSLSNLWPLNKNN